MPNASPLSTQENNPVQSLNKYSYDVFQDLSRNDHLYLILPETAYLSYTDTEFNLRVSC